MLRGEVRLRHRHGRGRIEHQTTGSPVLLYVYPGGTGRGGVLRRRLERTLSGNPPPQVDGEPSERQATSKPEAGTTRSSRRPARLSTGQRHVADVLDAAVVLAPDRSHVLESRYESTCSVELAV